MWILAYFTHDGEPALGLSPVVTIRDVETGISGASMAEKGDGFYGYYFTSFNFEQNYAVICDSITLSGVERYTYAASGEYNSVLNDIESTVGIVDLRTDLLRKIQTNRLELFDGDTDNWILYDDDGTTPLLTFSVSDKDGNIIVQCPNTPSKRSHAKGFAISGSGTPEIYMRKSVYDPNNNGYVNAAESVTDGIYTSTAVQIKGAINKAHSSYQLGTKFVTESGISDGKVLAYNSAIGKLVYTTISGATMSGASDHGQLMGLDDDDHIQYLNITRGDARYYTQTQLDSGQLDNRYFTESEITTISGNLQSQIDNKSDISHTHDSRYYTESEIDTISGSLYGKIINTVSEIYTIYYLHKEAGGIDGYGLLVGVPSNHDEAYHATTISVADGETLIYSYITASGLPNTTHIIAGTWIWLLWADVDSVSQGPHYLRAKWYRREQDGAEHLLFEQEQEITSTTPTIYRAETSISGITMSTTDRLVLKVYAETSANSNRTIRYYIEGSDHATRYDTPVYTNYIYDHGSLDGLTDDDHLQYVRVDGSRGFTATITGVDPVQPSDLATKNYVDNRTTYRIHEHGRQTISSGVSQVSVVFATELSSTDYTVDITLENTTDPSPSIYGLIVTTKATTGFTATLAGVTDSANYVLDWFVIPK